MRLNFSKTVKSSTYFCKKDIEVNGELFENAKIKVIHEEDTTTFETIVEVTEEVSTEVKLEVQQGTDNILLHEKTVEGNV